MSRWYLFFTIQLAVIGLDRITKILARHYLVGAGRLSYAWDLLRLEYSQNSGAFLSLGASLAPEARFFLFTALSGLLLLGLLVVLVGARDLPRAEFVALSLVLAGGLSNMIDRVMNHGRVEDFLNVGIGGLRTGIFNVGDMAITFGVILALLAWYIQPRKS